MCQAALRLGYQGSLALESSVVAGNFLGLMPAKLEARTRFIGVEYDILTARIAGLLYPQETILHSGFQSVPLPDGQFDLAIGNPPFGEQYLRFRQTATSWCQSVANGAGGLPDAGRALRLRQGGKAPQSGIKGLCAPTMT
jgi:hypothetical protein